MFVLIAFLALLIETGLGYPDRLFRAIGHPVTWIGRLISWMDGRFNRAASPSTRRMAGIAALLTLLAVSIAAGLVLQRLLAGWAGLLLLAVLASSLLAQRSLRIHVESVAAALETGGLDAGRIAVSHIVGRDPQSLDEAGVSRAAIESLAENFSDGVVAPAFWLALAGLPGGIAYKAINTADSMIGHRTPRHLAFGWASARLDDLVNLPASRLCALLICAAAALVPGASPAEAWRAVWRDARYHKSPNAGWPEAAMAGALGLALAGPRSYGGVLVDDVFMGEGGRREADAADIRRALRLYRIADALLIGLAGVCAASVLAL
ncbi:adenosylcobinamide-phosphate synthase CbiB [Neoaquamicrobium sediminum]|uniref:adenosylcobinamide-phosphate synthase CbiB n=1 Tax=Neoaquamicrobium sediminum TaxID=1849104 RepID=UPI003BACC2DD